MGKEAVVETSKGVIKIKLFDRECPKTVSNFEKLASQGFYDGTKFHRVIKNFMIQGGDPNTKTGEGSPGTGGPGFETDCEIVPGVKHKTGSFAMAHAGTCKHDPSSGVKIKGRCSNGSQFYITHLATAHLDGVHTVFGQVIEGQSIVDAIRQNDEVISLKVNQTK